MRALAIVALLAGVAHADVDIEPDGVAKRDAADASVLGLHLAFGDLPIGREHRIEYSQALTYGVAIAAGFRLHGEAEMVWLEDNADVARDVHGFAGRGQLAVRHAIATWKILYADLEGGFGGALGWDTRLGRFTQPDAFAGVRLGYVFDGGDGPSKLFEAEFEARVISVPEGWGWMAGVGMAWGN